MPSVSAAHTVAEQVAALPPLSQLLGLDEAEENNPPKAARRTKQVRHAMTTMRTTTATKNDTAPAKARGTRTETATKQKAGTTTPPTTQAPSTEDSPAPPSSPENAAATSSVAPPSPTCFPGGLREWRHVQSTLQLPLAYRGEDDIKVTLRLLRSLSFFSSLLDHDLLTLAETISLVEVPEAGTVVLRKRARFVPPPGAAATPMTATTSAAPSAFAGGASMLSEDDDDDDAAAASRPSWMIPAAELFHHFRSQMAQGDQPSLPAGCGERDARSTTSWSASGVPQVAPRGTAVGASPGRSASLARLAALSEAQAADEVKTPLFHVPEGWQDDDDYSGSNNNDNNAEEPFVVVLLSGHCELRWPRQRGPAEPPNALRYHSYTVQPGDAMGYALVWNALPAGARYVTSDTCTLLKVSADGHARDIKDRLNRACRRANDIVYKAQRIYLAEKLRVPLFRSEPAGEEGSNEKASTVEVKSAADRKRVSKGPSNAVQRDSSAASLDMLLDMAARRLIPVRVASETVLLQEGLSPATECGLYFVVEGSCTVVRRLWSQDQQRLETRKAQLVKELTPPNGVRPVLASMPSTSSMEVAQLRPGDFCGDLAYLRVDPDNATSIDAEWTSAYWQNTFIPSSREGEEVEGEDSALASSLRARRQQVQSAAGGAASERTESRSLFRRHKATVTTLRSSQLFVLLPSAAAVVLRGEVLDRMHEHAAACPGYLTLLTEYEKLYKWAIYKERVLCDESKKTNTPLR